MARAARRAAMPGGSMVEDDPLSAPVRNGLGETALILGVVALVFAFVPVVGDFIAVPAAVLAIGLGVLGLRRVERGLASNAGQAAAGAILGAISASLTMILFIATLDRIE